MADEALEAFIENVCGDSHLRVEADLGDGFVRLRSAEAERRQAAHDIRSTEDIVIEMLRNARDAHAKSIFLAVSREGQRRRLVMIDDGDGVPAAMHERIFEPRVTSKLDSMHMDKWGIHGRGMALYSIAVNAETARVVASDAGKGAALFVETNLDKLGEKTDQSSFPVFERTESGSIAVRGPKNILRTACEFAIECRHDCTVYLGSLTDIAATLYAFGLSSLTSAMRAFCADASELPVAKRLSVAVDPASFADEAEALGLVISERSARRILDGEIAPVELADQPRPHRRGGRRAAGRTAGEGAGGRCARSQNRARRPRIVLATRSMRVLGFGALTIYLESAVKPDVRVGKDGVHIRIPVEKLRLTNLLDNSIPAGCAPYRE